MLTQKVTFHLVLFTVDMILGAFSKSFFFFYQKMSVNGMGDQASNKIALQCSYTSLRPQTKLLVEINQLFPFAKKKRTSITKLLLNKGMTKETAHPSETKSKRNLFTVSIYQKRLSKGVKRIILLTSFRFCFSTFLNKTSFFF